MSKFNSNSIYFIGILGSGMLPLALWAQKKGFLVAGSDKNIKSKKINFLKENNISFNPSYNDLSEYQTIVYSSAISETHHELVRARELNKIKKHKLLHRMDFLVECMKEEQQSIAIAGTHGKSSSTAMLAWLLIQFDKNPSLIMGARPLYIEEGFKVGMGEVGVYESDESDGSFLKSNSKIRLVLNIDEDHIDYYKSFNELTKAFQRFILDGELVVTNANDVNLHTIAINTFTNKNKKIKIIGFQTFENEIEFNKQDHTIKNINYDKLYLAYFKDLTDKLYVLDTHIALNENSRRTFEKIGLIQLRLPGRHFAENSLGVLALLDMAVREGYIKIKDYSIQKAIEHLNTFPGLERRLEYIGKYNDVYLYDDYGHHPTEIQAVLLALKERLSPKAQLRVIFQPHRYTRTQALYQEFAKTLGIADQIYLMNIYPAGEKKIKGVDSHLIYDSLKMILKNKFNEERIKIESSFKTNAIEQSLKEKLFIKNCIQESHPNDIVLGLGAGSISQILRESFTELEK